jgi:hypothetical protein
MNRMNFLVGLILAFVLLLEFTSDLSAQRNRVRASLKASVSQTLGVDTEITIVYGRPGVKGRKIWGELVPYGMYPGNKASDNKPYPWRAGANENTTIELSKDILIEGKKLAAGKYGIHMIASEKDWVVIFSKNNSQWGSFKYNQDEDALRVTVTPMSAPDKEWLTYEFEDLAGNSATLCLRWEKLKVPIKIALPE